MKIAVTHITTACVLLEIGPIRILTDPVFDGGRQKYRLGPAAYATRMAGPAIDLVKLLPIDAVLLSHAHHLDNLDESGLQAVHQARCVITCRNGSERAGENAIRLSTWEDQKVESPDGFSVQVIAVPAQHGPWWFPGTGHITGFILRWTGQDRGALYISGDTVYFRGLKQIAKRYNVAAALLHLGAVHFWPPWPSLIRFTFNGSEAARVTRLLDPSVVIPIHYEQSIWSHFREPLESYRTAFGDAGVSSRVRWLTHGVRTSIQV